MSTPIEKIDVEKVRGRYTTEHSAGDDTTLSLKQLAEKINEIIDFCNKDFPKGSTAWGDSLPFEDSNKLCRHHFAQIVDSNPPKFGCVDCNYCPK